MIPQERNILAWLWKNSIVTEDRRPVEFHDHFFLLDIFNDFSEKQVIMKSAQVGVSITMILKTLWWLVFKEGNIIYTLPTSDDVRKFVPSKVNTLIKNNFCLGESIGDKDTIEQKHIGNNFIWYQGTFIEKQAIMLSSTLNVYDEVDRSNQEVLDIYSSRLLASKWKGEWFISNPSYPLMGVDRYFDLSDKKLWMIRCSRCTHQQFMKWPDSIDESAKAFICLKCKKELPYEDRRVGEWKVTNPGAYFSGYQISQLICPQITAADLLTAFKLKTKESFYNYYLGLPYVGSDITIGPELILNNLSAEPFPDKGGYALGVDQGLIKHYVLGNHHGIVKVGKTEHWEEIEQIIEQYKPITVIDALPDLTIPRQLRDKYRSRVYLSYYRRDRDKPEIIRFGEGEHHGSVYADRNKLLQMLFDELKDKKRKYYIPREYLTEYISHFTRFYKTFEEDSIGIKRPIWNCPPGVADHLCLAGNTLVITKTGEKPISNITIDDDVLTRSGWKKVLRAWKTKSDAKVITVHFDEKSLTGTPDHKIFTARGWITLDALSPGDILLSCKSNPNFSMGLLLGDTQMQKNEPKEFILSPMQHGEKKELVDYIKKFGRRLMGKSQKILLSIMKITIHLITRLKILNAPPVQRTNHIMHVSRLKTQTTTNPLLTILKKFNHSLMRGGVLVRAVNGIANMLLNHLFCRYRKNLIAISVESIPKQDQDLVENFAQNPVVVAFIENKNARQDVYNLTIEDQHEYYASGVLVANCHATALYRIALERTGKEAVVTTKSVFGFLANPSFFIDPSTKTIKASELVLEERPRDWVHSL